MLPINLILTLIAAAAPSPPDEPWQVGEREIGFEELLLYPAASPDERVLPKDCRNLRNSEECDDGNPCTLQDRCQQGACKGFGTISCEARGWCQTGECNPGTGRCDFANHPNGKACIELNQCGEADMASQCIDGRCVARKPLAPCPNADSEPEPRTQLWPRFCNVPGEATLLGWETAWRWFSCFRGIRCMASIEIKPFCKA